MRVLLVDDIPDQVRKYQKVILDLGHEVEAVSDSRVAWDLLESETFDALVSDVQMPFYSGLELVRMMWYMRCEIPTLLHSSESRHSDGRIWIELTEIPEVFKFVTFHLKQYHIEPTYIKDFLNSL